MALFNFMIKKIDHIGILVHDMDEAMEKYAQAFKLKTQHVEINDEFKVKICFIPVGEVLVEFIEPTERGSKFDLILQEKGETVHHIAYRVDNIDEAVKHLRNMNIGLQQDEPTSGGAGSRIIFVDPADTNNIEVELVERTADL